jgi:hypothetical protein
MKEQNKGRRTEEIKEGKKIKVQAITHQTSTRYAEPRLKHKLLERSSFSVPAGKLHNRILKYTSTFLVSFRSLCIIVLCSHFMTGKLCVLKQHEPSNKSNSCEFGYGT